MDSGDTVDSDIRCERCTLSIEGAHGIGECPLEPLHSPLRVSKQGNPKRSDPETIIREHGVEKLSKTYEGRRVIENARAKYRAELIQPGEPGFDRYWGKDVARREKDMAQVKEESRRMKREVGMV